MRFALSALFAFVLVLLPTEVAAQAEPDPIPVPGGRIEVEVCLEVLPILCRDDAPANPPTPQNPPSNGGNGGGGNGGGGGSTGTGGGNVGRPSASGAGGAASSTEAARSTNVLIRLSSIASSGKVKRDPCELSDFEFSVVTVPLVGHGLVRELFEPLLPITIIYPELTGSCNF